ncbi:hypothetical protein CsSME_00019015 [Camellia sinensis var. sinensis]
MQIIYLSHQKIETTYLWVFFGGDTAYYAKIQWNMDLDLQTGSLTLQQIKATTTILMPLIKLEKVVLALFLPNQSKEIA